MVYEQFPVEDDIYRRCVTFIYGSREQINKAIPKDAKPIEPCGNGKWIVYEHNGGFQADFICVVRAKTVDEEFAVLGHEALHHVGHVLRTAGIAFTDETDEAYCYYHQWIVERCMRIIRKARRKV